MTDRADRHDWNTWEHYENIHRCRISDYSDHFLILDELDAIQSYDEVVWAGILYFQDGIELHVRKNQEVRRVIGRAEVRTVRYNYHALRRVTKDYTINILRYDNAHPHEGHPTPHHRHYFDETGAEMRVDHVGVEGWPTLSDIIDELYGYWQERKLSDR